VWSQRVRIIEVRLYYEVPNGDSPQRAGRGSREDGTLFVFQRIRISLALLSDEREEIKDWAIYKHRRESRGTLAR